MEEELRERSPVYRDQVQLMADVFGERHETDGLDQRQRILIALGMAVQGGPKSAVEWTMTRALNHGASEQMIQETIDIALLTGGTFAVSNARFAYEAMRVRQQFPQKSK
jgi:alkylhydroperoxidase/carboxymuconolactone decarboxylase family protein YurZ